MCSRADSWSGGCSGRTGGSKAGEYGAKRHGRGGANKGVRQRDTPSDRHWAWDWSADRATMKGSVVAMHNYVQLYELKHRDVAYTVGRGWTGTPSPGEWTLVFYICTPANCHWAFYMSHTFGVPVPKHLYTALTRSSARAGMRFIRARGNHAYPGIKAGVSLDRLQCFGTQEWIEELRACIWLQAQAALRILQVPAAGCPPATGSCLWAQHSCSISCKHACSRHARIRISCGQYVTETMTEKGNK